MCQAQMEKREQYLFATLQGEMTLGCTAEVKEKVKEYAALYQQYHIIADMTDVDFIDSSGLGILVAWFKMCNQEDGKFVLCNLDKHVRRIISYAKLDKIFHMAEDLEAAEKML